MREILAFLSSIHAGCVIGQILRVVVDAAMSVIG